MDQFTACLKSTPDSATTSIVEGHLSLMFEQRQKSRQRARLKSGEIVALMLPRGVVMRDGDRLMTETGRVIGVLAAPEPVSTVQTDNAQTLARMAYHLGNRHVWVQIGPEWLRYLADRVLDNMVRGFGLEPVFETTPFEPEAGAYHHHLLTHAHPS